MPEIPGVPKPVKGTSSDGMSGVLSAALMKLASTLTRESGMVKLYRPSPKLRSAISRLLMVVTVMRLYAWGCTKGEVFMIL